MRSYYVDELAPREVQRLQNHLAEQGLQGSVEGMFWLPLPENLLTDEQRAHASQCGPFVASLEIGCNWLKAELLIRGRGRLRCSCIGYATSGQRQWLITEMDTILDNLSITV